MLNNINSSLHYDVAIARNNSVFAEKQLEQFKDHVVDALEVLIEWIKARAHEVSKIVYLASDIMEIAQNIPSWMDKQILIDMTTEIDQDIQIIAEQVEACASGYPYNISDQITNIKNNYT